MLWDTVKLSFRFMLLHILTLVFSTIGLSVILDTEMSEAIKLVASLVFMIFWLALVWDNATRRGAEDTKAGISLKGGMLDKNMEKRFSGRRYYAAKGYLAGAISMLVPLLLTVAYCLMAYRGWEKPSHDGANLLYLVLALLFRPFQMPLAAATLVSPLVTVSYISPAIINIDLITLMPMVMPYMFFIPPVLITVLAGAFYQLGHSQKIQLLPSFKKLVKK